MKNDTVSTTGTPWTDVFGITEEITLIFTWVVFSVLCQLIDIFGIVTNIINIICFVKQGFKDPVGISLLGLSISDLCCLITLTWTNIFVTPVVNTADPPFDPMEVYYLISATPHLSFTRVSSWITAIITTERCLCVIAPLKAKTFVTPKRTSVTIVGVVIILFFSVSPVYIVNRLDMKFSPARNKTLLGLVAMEGRESVEKISFLINNFIIPMAAFIIIILCTVTLAVKLESRTTWRQKSATSLQADRVSNRNQKVAKMVVIMSTLFIVCFFPICIGMLAAAFEPELYVSGKYMNIAIIVGGFGFILESINSSVNIFIYYHMSSKYRSTFANIFCKTKTLGTVIT